MGPFIAVCCSLNGSEISEKELFCFGFLRAFVSVHPSSNKLDKFSDSFGFRRSFLQIKQVLSFVVIPNIDRKDSCVRHYSGCQNKFARRHVLKCVENLHPDRFFLPPKSICINPFHKPKVIYPVSKLSKVHFKTGIDQEFPVFSPKSGVTKT